MPVAPPALLVVTLLLVGLSACGPPQAHSPDRYPVGIAYGGRLTSMSDDGLDDALDDAVDAHANWIRADLSWHDVQRGGPGSWDWSGFDRVVQAAHARHLKVLAVAAYSPTWARVPGCDTFACPPRDPADFTDFLAGAAKHYRSDVAAYEIWNEPNSATFWRSPDPALYGSLAAGATRAVHAVDGEAVVLLGGLAASVSEGIGPTDFIRAACADERCADVDGVAFHPYTFPGSPREDPDGVNAWSRMTRSGPSGPSLRSTMEEAGIGNKPIWVTEYGAPTGGSPGSPVSERRQAQLITDGVRSTAADRGTAGLFVYTWEDLPGDDTSLEAHFGIVRTDRSRKPAFDALTNAARRAQAGR